MVSEKMKSFVNGSSAIRAMFTEGKRLASIYGAENVYDYSLGNPSVIPPDSVKKSIIEILNTKDPNYIHGYPDNSGFEEVREYVAQQTNKEFGTDFTYKNVVMTTGAAAALNIIFKTILNPGDEVIVFAPFFGEYRNYVSNYDGKLVVVPTNKENFQIDIDSLEKNITPRTKAIIINSPNNPTGVIYTEETILKLSDTLYKKQEEFGTEIFLLSDEPYRRLVYDDANIPFITKYYDNSFVSYSFSKALSLPGERIGYVIANTNMSDFEDTMTALNVANRIMGFVNAPSLFQLVLPYVMNEQVDVNIYKKNRDKLYEILTSCGFECPTPEGAFYMFPKSLIEDDVEFCEKAKEYNLLLVPGSAFGCPGYIRLAYCVNYETIVNSEKAFKKLADFYKG